MNKERILIIEDAQDLREPIAEMLELEGYAVEQAANGREGFDKVQTCLPDLVLCDIMMPEMDGYEVLQRMRAEATCADVPFVFLTAKANRADVRKGMLLSADDYLTKPVQDDDLLETIEAQLGRARLKRLHFEQRLQTICSDVAGVVPKELMTPLTSILALSEYMSSEQEPDARLFQELAGDINASGVLLLRMVRNYLFCSQMVFLSRQREPVFCDSEIEEVEPGLLEHWAMNCARWWNREEDVRLVLGTGAFSFHPGCLEHLIVQLLDNAFKFSQPGQSVELEAALEGDAFRVCVRDRGVGMSPEAQLKVSRLESCQTIGSESCEEGLGLFIVRAVLQLHGGRWDFRSEPGKGTRVEAWVSILPENWRFKLAGGN